MSNFTNGPPITIQFAMTAASGTYTALNGLIQYECPTTRPVWTLLDLLLWCGWNISDINIPSFIAADAACAPQVSYIDQNGNTQTKDRYKYQNVLRQRRSAAQAVRGILGSMNAVAVPNSGGALTLVVKQTLADQQPTLPDGSNYSTAVASVHADGTAGNGYVAYAFDESNIIRDNEGRGKPKFNIVQRANSDLPALVTVNWQDEDNQYVVDSLTVADLPALQRVSQNTTAAPPAEGFANYDQVRRIVNTWFAENAWGNPRNDPGGTFQVQITTTFKGVKLQIGQIVMLSWAQAGISQQLFRILQLKPSTDFETVDLLLQWHEDAWYTNAYGQATTPGGNGSGSMLPMRPPYPIMIGECGDAINPLHPGANSRLALYSSTGWYSLAPQERILGIQGLLPVNTFSQDTRPPFVPAQATTSPIGGSMAGGQTVWCAFAAEDASGAVTPLSSFVSCYIPAGTNTNTVAVSGIQWAPGTVACHAWMGSSPQTLFYAGRSASVLAAFELSHGLEASWIDTPMPDQCFQTLRVRVKRLMHPGVWAGTVTGWTGGSTGTFTVQGAGWTVNQFAGRFCSIVGWKSTQYGGADMPQWMDDYLIVSNTADTLTVGVGWFGYAAGDLLQLVIRAQNTGSGLASGIADSNLTLTANSEINRIVRIIAGTGRGQVATIASNDASGNIVISGTWGITPDSTSEFWIEEAGWGVGTQDINPGRVTTLATMDIGPWWAIDVAGFAQQYLMIEPVAVSASGLEALPLPQGLAIRDFYLFVETGDAANTAPAAAIVIPGTLAIGSDLGPIAAMPQTSTPSNITVQLKRAPTGAALVVVVYVNGVVYATITVPAGATSASVATSTQIVAGQLIRVDITAVGTTYPGSDMTVFINP
jgi:hypothetical protein